MNKIAFLFAGQGSQYVGMGKELYENYDIAKSIFDKANEILDLGIKKLCFEGSEEELSRTENTQPCMMTPAYAISSVLKEKGIEASYAAGLSLGEYSALVYAGLLTFEEGLKLIQKRGKLMQNAVPDGIGSMAAILGLDIETIENYCKEFKNGILEVANYNCPGQIVITGEKFAVEKAALDLKTIGALKTVVLKVSGPFHSSMMKNAAIGLEAELLKLNYLSSNKFVLSNFDNEYYDGNKNNIIYKLKNQICSSVRWEDNIKKMIEEGVETFIEIGPGKALSAFMRKIDKSKVVYNVEDIKTLEKLFSELVR
jgi:[acyl-carrier-protein] S-malonyltransferase